METLATIIKQEIQNLYAVEADVVLTRPNSEFGDYATNIALKIAKDVSKNPMEIAESLATSLKKHDEIESVSVAAPGFVNITVKSKTVADFLNNNWTNSYGSSNTGNSKIVVVDFPSPNMAKPYSVGHLRPGNQGWAIKRLMEETGWKVITDNHLGDYGSPFGVWVVGFIKYSSEEALNRDGVYELGRIYIKTKADLKQKQQEGKSELSDLVQSWLIKLENKDKEALSYSERFNKISLDHIHNVMNRLRIHTDYELGESSFVDSAKQQVEQLLASSVATKNEDGSVVVDLKSVGIDVPLLIQKSNGTILYATTDIATLQYRMQNWHPDRIIYCVGAEQQFYFKQLFGLASKLGLDIELIHLWFGVIDQIGENGVREKMSSRKGVVLMEELLDSAEAKAREIVKDRVVSDEDVKTIALGAIKFSDFASDRRTNILFDWDKIFALTGFSGPYVQYAAVRLKKIIHAYSEAPVIDNSYDYKTEKNLLLTIIDFPSVVELSARDLEPHKIASYAYELAREINRYYETTRISESSELELGSRLNALSKAYAVLERSLNILGIDVPESM